MAQDDLLPPACAFAISVLAERDQDPDSVPEEAVEAAQQHMAACARCLSAPLISPAGSTPQRKKKKVRRAVEPNSFFETSALTSSDKLAVPPPSQFEPTPLLDMGAKPVSLATTPGDFSQPKQATYPLDRAPTRAYTGRFFGEASSQEKGGRESRSKSRHSATIPTKAFCLGIGGRQ